LSQTSCDFIHFKIYCDLGSGGADNENNIESIEVETTLFNNMIICTLMPVEH